MKTEYNPDGTIVRITGDYSPHPVFATSELVAQLGGAEPAYHEIKRLQRENLLPCMGSSAHPLTARDLRYARDNEQRGRRHWRWLQMEGPHVRDSIGYDFVYGYGFADGGDFVFVNAADAPVYRVPCGLLASNGR